VTGKRTLSGSGVRPTTATFRRFRLISTLPRISHDGLARGERASRLTRRNAMTRLGIGVAVTRPRLRSRRQSRLVVTKDAERLSNDTVRRASQRRCRSRQFESRNSLPAFMRPSVSCSPPEPNVLETTTDWYSPSVKPRRRRVPPDCVSQRRSRSVYGEEVVTR